MPCFLAQAERICFDDWAWLYKKVGVCISLWVNRWLSRGDILVLLKSVLQSILVYWTSIAKVPKGILTKIQKKCFQFLWSGSRNRDGIPLVKWTNLAKIKNWAPGHKKLVFFQPCVSRQEPLEANSKLRPFGAE
jgi:hypothetical protein